MVLIEPVDGEFNIVAPLKGEKLGKLNALVMQERKLPEVTDDIKALSKLEPAFVRMLVEDNHKVPTFPVAPTLLQRLGLTFPRGVCTTETLKVPVIGPLPRVTLLTAKKAAEKLKTLVRVDRTKKDVPDKGRKMESPVGDLARTEEDETQREAKVEL